MEIENLKERLTKVERLGQSMHDMLGTIMGALVGSKSATPEPPKPGVTNPLKGDGQVMAWVMTGPAPYNNVSFVCSPDPNFPFGIYCRAEALINAEPVSRHVVLMDDNEIEEFRTFAIEKERMESDHA